ncbi:uncharacterized protein LOC108915906 [Anoplophora glabripennis]|uniref:uncharacterized protein LOC108915906 n=1 Tax=Anoplophora glabripennis TaxID=217634 RepID=UPI0008754230|nr:uncharacterized protein LOC108915906 [Anoplophora glabripennis]
MPFTLEQDAFILMAFFRSGTRNEDGSWTYSLQSCIEQFRKKFPDANVDYDTFLRRKCVILKRFKTKQCVCGGKSTDRKIVPKKNDDKITKLEHNDTFIKKEIDETELGEQRMEVEDSNIIKTEAEMEDMLVETEKVYIKTEGNVCESESSSYSKTIDDKDKSTHEDKGGIKSESMIKCEIDEVQTSTLDELPT